MLRPKAGKIPPGELTTLGRLLWWTGCVRYYRDGTTFSALFRWWHPVTWIIWIVMLQVCGIIGERVSEVVPIRLKGHWKANRHEIQWLRP